MIRYAGRIKTKRVYFDPINECAIAVSYYYIQRQGKLYAFLKWNHNDIAHAMLLFYGLEFSELIEWRTYGVLHCCDIDSFWYELPS